VYSTYGALGAYGVYSAYGVFVCIQHIPLPPCKAFNPCFNCWLVLYGLSIAHFGRFVKGYNKAFNVARKANNTNEHIVG
jgi:hypothetical protein